ncbi:MAG: D-tyrosyl-tRNA(Tyr) deacylase [Gammaproteobacteria bacterium]|nr:MAG: D-tyrosyl-tRNA(Tyr) deacylase [Gammaproteobacteria bacterium]
MRGLIQRVSRAAVEVNGEVVGAIDRGILLLLGIEASDGDAQSSKLMDKVLNYRIFPDEGGRMNLSVKDIAGGVLVVSQFTLVADTGKGLRPGFSSAAKPDQAARVYESFVAKLQAVHDDVATGIFAADMQVSLCNDGPVTFLLEV